MRIAILSYEYPPETGFGGIGTYSYYHARALARLGHSVHVFAGSMQTGIHHSEHDGVGVTRIKIDGWLKRLLGPARARKLWWFHNRVETAHAQYVALRRFLERESIDIVEAPECGADAAAVSLLLGVPVAVRFHSPAKLIMGSYQTPELDRTLTAAVERIAMTRARVRTACSQFVADQVADVMQVPRPIHVIPNGIDLELFDRSGDPAIRRRFGVPADALTVLFANRLEERKGIHLMADIASRVMRRYPHVHFVLAGRDLFGYAANQLVPKIRDKGLADRFHVLGALDLADVRALVKSSDVFLLASMWENCPYSCIEAMAAGRAIVSSDCGGMPELIADGRTGLLARNGDATSFAERIETLVESADLRQRLGSAARRVVEERLTDVAVAHQIADLYQRTLGPAPAHSG
jgi:glycosyltransferase involved in cell wall biosynthesis